MCKRVKYQRIASLLFLISQNPRSRLSFGSLGKFVPAFAWRPASARCPNVGTAFARWSQWAGVRVRNGLPITSPQEHSPRTEHPQAPLRSRRQGECTVLEDPQVYEPGNKAAVRFVSRA